MLRLPVLMCEDDRGSVEVFCSLSVFWQAEGSLGVSFAKPLSFPVIARSRRVLASGSRQVVVGGGCVVWGFRVLGLL